MNATVAKPEQTRKSGKEYFNDRAARIDANVTPVAFTSREEARAARDRVQAEDFFALERILKPAN